MLQLLSNEHAFVNQLSLIPFFKCHYLQPFSECIFYVFYCKWNVWIGANLHILSIHNQHNLNKICMNVVWAAICAIPIVKLEVAVHRMFSRWSLADWDNCLYLSFSYEMFKNVCTGRERSVPWQSVKCDKVFRLAGVTKSPCIINLNCSNYE